jgi:hypothetical protein
MTTRKTYSAAYKAAIGVALFFAIASFREPAASATTDVRLVTDEADAVLAILARRKVNQLPTVNEWQRLLSSEGYLRLKKREAEMKMPYEDQEFRTFVLSDALTARAGRLEETLARWKRADIQGALTRALAYLPPGSRIQAKVYPVIKPRENSFVFEVVNDPAIFLYLDPDVTHEQFENTLAHELHHIGFGSGCASKRSSLDPSKFSPRLQNVLQWLGAFGEGFAMLAAAGGPDVHPHAASKAEDKERWDRDVANFDQDLKKVETFFQEVLDGKLAGEELRDRAYSFFGVQGPWYTVGWKMAVTIERVYGRARLIDCMCDQRQLLATYNDAALKQSRTSGERPALWSQSLVKAVKGGAR